jgi:N-glycosylase/DNA lyase
MGLIKAGLFDLKHTLDSGQVFSWQRTEGQYLGVIQGRAARIAQAGDTLDYAFSANGSAEIIRDYFRLDDDLETIYAELNKDPVLAKATQKYPGLRLIRQEPWECMVSFMCSVNNNIPRIKGMIRNLSERYGAQIQFKGNQLYAFPTKEQLSKASAKDLMKCGLGFRAEWVHAACRAELDFYELKEIEYLKAKERLMQLKGIGDKVADCVLLFSLEKHEAFPVDVWIRRVMSQLYFKGRAAKDKEIRQFAMDKWQHAGYAQQYLYHYTRLHKQGQKD